MTRDLTPEERNRAGLALAELVAELANAEETAKQIATDHKKHIADLRQSVRMLSDAVRTGRIQADQGELFK
jgi:ABC-type Fe3+-hydroxamate transport system substrate-binding protein